MSHTGRGLWGSFQPGSPGCGSQRKTFFFSSPRWSQCALQNAKIHRTGKPLSSARLLALVKLKLLLLLLGAPAGMLFVDSFAFSGCRARVETKTTSLLTTCRCLFFFPFPETSSFSFPNLQGFAELPATFTQTRGHVLPSILPSPFFRPSFTPLSHSTDTCVDYLHTCYSTEDTECKGQKCPFSYEAHGLAGQSHEVTVN